MLRVKDKIESILLYDKSYPIFDGPEISSYLNFVFEKANIRFQVSQQGDDRSFILLAANGGFFVLISQNRSALGPNGFQPAIASPIRQLLFPELDRTVARHTGNIAIAVSSEVPLGTKGDELKKMLGMADPEQTPVQVEIKITICEMLTKFFADRSAPTAIHWCQSDQLVTPEYFKANTNGAFPSPIHVHPSLFSSGAVIGKRKVVGFRTYGACFVIGREIIFNEAPADLLWLYQRTLNFLQMARANKYQIIPDGDVFGANEDEKIGVKHRPPDERGVALVELTVLKSLEFDISEDRPLPSPPRGAGSVPSLVRTLFGKRAALH